MKRYIWLILIIALSIVLLTGCKKDPLPEERFETFIQDWEKQDFQKVYDQFSLDVKENIQKDEFENRFMKIYKDIGVDKLKISFKAPDEEIEPNDKGEVVFPYQLSMETIAGKIEFKEQVTLVLEEIDDEKNGQSNGSHQCSFLTWRKGMALEFPYPLLLEVKLLTETAFCWQKMALYMKLVWFRRT
ncbi:NTF2-like N-terminal transpeptidase domain-containing protein [Bacillus sp. REN16]|uniref:NTF2-like N-terminal transpeptidase domain-containing protein n=1 Tax=Bacillus sp. REN16 TaxID=2887296 RepID=UPI001E593725|nr:NTF2-like N-terminal transpeptidase domain-containing protein [Bacillus sp. REN16]MCC3356902.1 hypothetical protein [Bacillus sp. REN16]